MKKKFIDLKGKPMPVVTSEAMGAPRKLKAKKEVRIIVPLKLPPNKRKKSNEKK
jgi:hypothetical protein